MYLNYDNRHWACDIEGDLIPSTKVYCLCAVHVLTGEEFSSSDPVEIKEWVDERIREGCILVFHNGLGYDGPTLNRLLGTKIGTRNLVDTFLLSQMFSPSIEGGHSLAAWALRVHMRKIEFNDFSHYTPDMLIYCMSDASICATVYKELCRRMLASGFTEGACQLEHRAWAVLKRQKENGFYFDIERANVLMAILTEEANDLRDRIYERWPPRLECIRTYGRPHKKDGCPTKNYERHLLEYERVDISADRESYSVYGFVAFNLGSPDQRVEKLLALGWKPLDNERTKSGNPQPTKKGHLAPSLEEFARGSGNVEVQLLANWIDVSARLSMIKTWIDNYNEHTSCIHGSLWMAGTHRYRHNEPNTANIPGVRLDRDDRPLLGVEGVWTYESRDLWGTRDKRNRRMVGVDAKGIQLRVLCNYLNNTAFTRNILSADPHTANQKDFGLPTRSLAKTITYAILMGAGDLRVSSEAKVSLDDAKAAKALFFSRLPQLPRLISRLKGERNRTGRISLCDGSRILVPSDHMVIPYLLQGDESKIMKRAMYLIYIECKRLGIDALQVGMIHDELQYDVLASDVDRFIDICLAAFLAAGVFFKYNLPIEGDAKTGLTWAETH